MYAVIRSGGKQYRVSAGDSILLERLDAPEGSELTLDEVLLLEADGGEVTVGTPTVPGASVSASVEQHLRGRKVTSFKYKNKTRQRTRRGHRQHHTRVRITGISAG